VGGVMQVGGAMERGGGAGVAMERGGGAGVAMGGGGGEGGDGEDEVEEWGQEEHLYADVGPALLLGGLPAVVPAAPIVPQVVFPAFPQQLRKHRYTAEREATCYNCASLTAPCALLDAVVVPVCVACQTWSLVSRNAVLVSEVFRATMAGPITGQEPFGARATGRLATPFELQLRGEKVCQHVFV
jgi:hypothetical protein